MLSDKAKTVWFAKIVSILDVDRFTVHWFHQKSNRRLYTLQEDTEDQVHRDTVICSGVPMRLVKDRLEILWEPSLPVEVIMFLETTNSGITNITHKK